MDTGPLEILVLRAWLEPDTQPGLRVRITAVDPGRAADPGEAGQSLLATTSIDEACDTVRGWLTDVKTRAPGDAPVTARRRGEPTL